MPRFAASATAQSRIFWIAISKRFTPEDLPVVAGRKDSVTKLEVESHGYDIVTSGGIFSNKTYSFKERSPPMESYQSLVFVRLWKGSSIFLHRESRMRSAVLAEANSWEAAVPNVASINAKLYSWLMPPKEAPQKAPIG